MGTVHRSRRQRIWHLGTCLVNSSPHRDFRHMCSAAFDEDKGLRFWAGSIDARSHSCSAALKNACDPAYRNRYSKLLDRSSIPLHSYSHTRVTNKPTSSES